MTRALTVDPSGAGYRVDAFLDVLAYSEIKPALLAKSDDGYNVLVGSTPSKPLLFTGYDDHPRILNRAMNSTAAGRYQFIRATWDALARRLCLANFGPRCQDLACVELLKENGAYQALIAGDFDEALRCASRDWASLPYSKAGQPTNTAASLLVVYQAAVTKYQAVH
jgi:muramidase (phage lysozyme)